MDLKLDEDCLYTKQHEWIKVSDGTATIGITDYAQQELGDVVFVELPKRGDVFEANQPFGNVESVKAVSEIFCPVAGEVIETNQALVDAPELVNEDPYGKAWFIRITVRNQEELKGLFNHEEYRKFVAEETGQ
ncbi:MAG: glycine cleavage system protein GcvH [Acidobacteriota bacterium]